MRKILFLLICFPLLMFSQNEGNIWYFGYGAGLDFNSGSPVAIHNGQLQTLEGCATISDNNGSLLFYTDGMTVYDKNHAVMPNGTGLLGNNSSTQSGVIVQHPGITTTYYIFSVDGTTGAYGGLAYSEVDLTLNGGLGDSIAQLLARELPTPLEMVGVNDTFGESGTPRQLMEKYGLTSSDIINAVKKVLERK